MNSQMPGERTTVSAVRSRQATGSVLLWPRVKRAAPHQTKPVPEFRLRRSESNAVTGNFQIKKPIDCKKSY